MRDAFEGKDNEGSTHSRILINFAACWLLRARARAQVYRAALAAGIVL